MNKIRDLRKEKQLTQEQLGKMFGYSANAIGQYESGAREPSFNTLFQLADYFNVSIDYLLGYSETLQEVNNNKVNTLPDYQQEFIEYVKTMNELECFQAKAHIETLRKMQTDKQQARELYNILKRNS